MTLHNLSKEIKELLEEGIAHIIIYKVKRSWNFKVFWYDDVNDLYSKEDQAEIDEIKKIDQFYLDVDGYNDFLDYTLLYIKNRILKQYECNQEQIIKDAKKEDTTEVENDTPELFIDDVPDDSQLEDLSVEYDTATGLYVELFTKIHGEEDNPYMNDDDI